MSPPSRKTGCLILFVVVLVTIVWGVIAIRNSADEAVKIVKSYAAMSGIMSSLEAFKQDRGRYPTPDEFVQMAELGYWSAEMYESMWECDFIYEPNEDFTSYRLISLGKDCAPGGTGADEDVVRTPAERRAESSVGE